MATLRIDSNDTFSTDVTVRESDKHTRAILLKFEHICKDEEIGGCNEMFLSPGELDLLGRFLIRQADEIRTRQTVNAGLV